tara:strand:+ start:366 stop:683 length:318 start_codon:yes stop_codon:yes gene_type:complete
LNSRKPHGGFKMLTKEEVLKCIKEGSGDALKGASVFLRANKDLVLAAVKVNGLELRYAKANLQSDKQVIMAALENDGEALEYIADELKDDPEVLLAALRSMDRKA